ncbi:MAG: protein kinase [Planctomycetales bacterium]|nr:protein kinase [Planctomycetales bacterium]
MKPAKRFDDSDFESLLAHVADEYSEKLSDGEQPDIEEYARMHPAIADAIRRVLPAIHALDNSSSSATPLAQQAGYAPHETLGDFRILREIGRGGMGIVYEAEEQSLGRSVALKVLPFTAMLDEKQLTRFKNEARAAATLSHRNIVPVYSFGAEGSVHYYSMKYIRGQSMAELIRDLQIAKGDTNAAQKRIAGTLTTVNLGSGLDALSRSAAVRDAMQKQDGGTVRGNQASTHDERRARESVGHAQGTPAHEAMSTIADGLQSDTIGAEAPSNSFRFYRNVANLGVQAAQALDHAHCQGVLHRDIKPANIMVDRSMHLWITDFGLARLGDDAGVTMTGDLLGTARYMSPEQILAKRVVIDHRADIYSLGITLYELATLQVAFDGEDRYELWRQISFENPTAPRKLDARLPVELETIILKSIEKNPSDRYQTAAELADDLQRFLDNKPIKAKPPTVIGSAAKWAQRHQTFVWSTMAVMVVLIGILATSTFFITGAYRAAQSQTERAETTLQLLRDVLDTEIIGQIEKLKDAPGMTQEQHKLLLRLRTFYEQLPKDDFKDDSLFHDSVQAKLRLGDIHAILGQHGKAISAFEDAVSSAEQLCARASNPEYEATLVLALSGLGQAQLAVQERESAIRSHTAANERIEKLMVANKDNLAIQRLAAEKIHLPIAMMETKPRDKTFRSTIAELSELAKRFPEESLFPDAMAKAQISLGGLLQSQGRFTEAESTLRLAIETQEQLSRRYPTDPAFTFQHASALSHLAVLLQKHGDYEAALNTTNQGIEYLGRLTKQFPDRVNFRTALAQLQNDLGSLYSRNDKAEEAAEQFKNAIAILEPLTVSAPETPSHRYSLATNLNNLGAVTAATDSAFSRECKRRALQLFSSLATRYPHDAQYRFSLAVSHANASQGIDRAERLRGIGKAIEILDRLTVEYPERVAYSNYLIRYKTELCRELNLAGRKADAEAEFQDVMKLSKAHRDRNPEPHEADDVSSVTRAELSWQLGKVEETVLEREIAINGFRLLLEQKPDDVAYKTDLCSQLKRIAIAHLSLGHYDQALEYCHESITLNKQLRHDFPEDARFLQKLSRRYDLLAVLHLRKGNFEQAEDGLRMKLDTIQTLSEEFPGSHITTQSIVETHLRLAHLIDESDPSRIDDACDELVLAYDRANLAQSAVLKLLVRLHHGALLNRQQQFDLSRPMLVEALSIAREIERRLMSDDIQSQIAVTKALWQIGAEFARAGDEQQASELLTSLTSMSHAIRSLRSLQAWGIANWPEIADEHLEVALVLSQNGIDEEPNNGARWLNHSFVQLRSGQISEATASLEQAEQLNAITMAGKLMQAIAYARGNDKAIAERHFTEVKDAVLFGDAFRLFEMRDLRDEAANAISQLQ